MTETTRIFAESERTAAQANPNLEYLVWQTAHDEATCLICAPMEGQRIQKGEHTFPGGYYPPAHPNCRCGVTAITEVAAERTVRAAELPPTYADQVLAKMRPIIDQRNGELARLSNREISLQVEKQAIDKKFDEAFEQVQRGGEYPAEEMKLIRARNDEIFAELKTFEQARIDIQLKAAQDAHAFVKAEQPSTVKFDFVDKPTAKERKAAIAGRDVFSSLVDERLLGTGKSLKVVTSSDAYFRAAYQLGDSTIEIGVTSRPGIVAHEMGHWLEDTIPGLHDKAATFLARRTAGEKEQHLGQGYGQWEYTRVDKFIDPYIGKITGGQSSEVISMGIQYLHDNPLALAEGDPDMFKFIVNLLRGE